MRQRQFELFEHVAIDVGLKSVDFQRTCLPSCRAMSPTARGKPCAAVAERPHAADDHFMIQPAVEVLGLGRVIVKSC